MLLSILYKLIGSRPSNYAFLDYFFCTVQVHLMQSIPTELLCKSHNRHKMSIWCEKWSSTWKILSVTVQIVQLWLHYQLDWLGSICLFWLWPAFQNTWSGSTRRNCLASILSIRVGKLHRWLRRNQKKIKFEHVSKARCDLLAKLLSLNTTKKPRRAQRSAGSHLIKKKEWVVFSSSSKCSI